MLIISRKKDEKIIVADDIEITVLEIGRNRVRFGVKAPKHVTIHTRLKTSPSEVDETAALAGVAADVTGPANSVNPELPARAVPIAVRMKAV